MFISKVETPSYVIDEGKLIENLKVGEPAEARFLLRENEEVKAVYEYCNLHGLWKLEN